MPARWVLEARTTCGLVTGLDDPDWDPDESGYVCLAFLVGPLSQRSGD
jgi:hypothetical protein